MTDNALKRIVIMGAAGRDFHNFNMVYRHDPASEVVAFTAIQIPGIGGRRYPLQLAGPQYPDGIPIYEAAELATLCRTNAIDDAVFAYSDMPHAEVIHRASIALAGGELHTPWPEPDHARIGAPESEARSTVLWGGEWEVTWVTFRDMGVAFAVTLTGIYILVVAQFGSFKIPLIILTPVPLR